MPWLTRFYFGNGVTGLKRMVSEQLGEIDAREINSIPIGDRHRMVRVGRYGPYVQRGDERASVPEDLAPDELTVARADELLSAGSSDRVIGTDPESGLDVVPGPAGSVPTSSSERPRRPAAGLGPPRCCPGWISRACTLADALRLLTLPRVVGIDPADRRRRSSARTGATARI